MIHINNFVDKIKFFEARNSKDFIISLSEAKNLHADITKLLLALHEQMDLPTHSTQDKTNTTISGEDW